MAFLIALNNSKASGDCWDSAAAILEGGNEKPGLANVMLIYIQEMLFFLVKLMTSQESGVHHSLLHCDQINHSLS